jgi:hypothetical protein
MGCPFHQSVLKVYGQRTGMVLLFLIERICAARAGLIDALRIAPCSLRELIKTWGINKKMKLAARICWVFKNTPCCICGSEVRGLALILRSPVCAGDIGKCQMSGLAAHLAKTNITKYSPIS